MSKRKAAIITGVSILIMAIAAGIGYGFIHSKIFIKGDVEHTFLALENNRHLLAISVIMWLIIITTDLIVSWSLFSYLKPSSLIKARMVGILRFVYTLFLMVAVMQLFQSYTLNEPQAVYDNMLSFEKIWYYGLIIFGAHLYYLGRTTCYSKLLPKFWSGLLVLAGLSYMVVSVGKIGFENSNWVIITEQVLTLPMALSEIGLAFWMLIKGGKIKANH